MRSGDDVDQDIRENDISEADVRKRDVIKDDVSDNDVSTSDSHVTYGMRRGIDMTQVEAAHKKRTAVSGIIILILIPLTVIGGSNLIGYHSYMLDCLVILIYTMIPFFMVFERRKPKAREIVLIAMMSALTAVIHLMLHFTVPVQAGTALVIISGIALGPEAGFLVGALGRFVCNFYLTQGAWTPWQMFCWGILGFLAGLAFNKANIEQLKERRFNFVAAPVIAMIFAFIAAYTSYLIIPGKDDSFFGWRLYAFGAAGIVLAIALQHKRLPIDGVTLAVFTFFVTFIVYGGVMNVAAMITSAAVQGSGQTVHTDTLRTLYIAGVPYDLAHAGSAALFIFLFGEPLIGKLERVKIKYGIYR